MSNSTMGQINEWLGCWKDKRVVEVHEEFIELGNKQPKSDCVVLSSYRQAKVAIFFTLRLSTYMHCI